MDPSGLRIGTPALTTRGLVEDDMREIAEVIAVALSDDFESQKDALSERTRALMDRYPLYPQLSRHRRLSRASAMSSGGELPARTVAGSSSTRYPRHRGDQRRSSTSAIDLLSLGDRRHRPDVGRAAGRDRASSGP